MREQANDSLTTPRAGPRVHPAARTARAVAIVLTMLLVSSPLLSLGQAPATNDVDNLGAQDVPVVAVLPERVLVHATTGLYDLVLQHQGDCSSLGRELTRYLDDIGDELAAAAATLSLRMEKATEEERAELARWFGEALAGEGHLRDAQTKLYPCLRTHVGQPKSDRVDRQMQRFYELHEPLMNTFVGPVD